MSSPLTSQQFVRLLDERLTAVSERKFAELPGMKEKFYNVISSDSAWEEYFDIGAVPDIPEFNGKLSALSISPGYHTKIEPKEYGAMITAERKLIDDKKYGVLDSRAEGLMESAGRKIEKLAARPFQYASSAAFDFMTSEENKALVSDSHTTKSGTSTATGFDNAGVSALSKTSVAATRILMRQFRNDISERIDMDDSWALIVPDNLADTAEEIAGTMKGLDTAEGNINPQYGRYEVIPYLRLDDVDSNNWYMVNKTMMKKFLLWINRVKPESKNTPDFHTYQLMQAIYFRVAYGWLDWRWIFGHIVS